MFLWPKNTGVLSSYEQTDIHILHMTAFCALDAPVASFSRLKLAHGGVKACNGRFESVRDGQKIQPGDAFRGTFNFSEFVDLKPLRSGFYVEYSEYPTIHQSFGIPVNSSEDAKNFLNTAIDLLHKCIWANQQGFAD